MTDTAGAHPDQGWRERELGRMTGPVPDNTTRPDYDDRVAAVIAAAVGAIHWWQVEDEHSLDSAMVELDEAVRAVVARASGSTE